MWRVMLALAMLCLGAPADAQSEPVRVVLRTGEGDIVLELDRARAPVTTANILRYVDDGRLDGATFYRAMRTGPDRGLVQGGVVPPRALPPVVHEPTSRPGLSHVDGAVALARGAPGTATADIYIVVGDMTYLDAGRGDPDGYAVFGRVVGGMDVVRRILGAATSPTEGEGAMRGQMLAERVSILTARRSE